MPYIVKYSIKRIGLLIVTAFIILSITFFLVKMLPEGALPSNEAAAYAFCQDQVAKGFYIGLSAPTEQYGKMVFTITTAGKSVYFYRNPIIIQYGSWIKGIFTQWDWGVSSAISPQTDAISIIFERLKPTIIINIVALIISLPLGFIFGILAALKKNTVTDNVISTVVMIFISVPSFVVISLLMLLFCYSNNILPNSWPSDGASIGAYAKAMVIRIKIVSSPNR